MRYVFVGGLAAVANIGLMALCWETLHLHYLVANIIGFLAGMLTNYALCKFFVFTDSISIPRAGEFAIYCIISLISLAIDSGLLWLFTQVFGFHPVVSKVLSTAIGFLWNYFGRKSFYVILKKHQKV
jgi:putative flippase GtrA